MPIRTMFIQDGCDRCGALLGDSRGLSFFTKDVICRKCILAEQETRQKIRAQGGDEHADEKYEGCGRVPTVE